MQYIDQHGRSVHLGTKLGTGGEGSVYEIVGNSDLVAKVYHQPATPEKAAKLSAMAGLATPEILAFAAWPTATLHRGRGGATLGIVLPRIKNSREIHELYSPSHRKVHYPKADWRFLIRVAFNCATAFRQLHEQGVVIGDVNQGNFFVSSQAIVSLIDCDSFQLQANGQLYRCMVGVAHFVPPELQNARLSEVTRTFNHDNFGLAVLIFHLLFMGRHPFAGRYSGSDEMPIERAIKEYRFAYSASASQQLMSPPPHSLTLSGLPPEIALLFERAFARGSERANARPSSFDWARALAQLEGQVRKCSDDPGHTYVSRLKDCPWCGVIQAGGPNFFISVSIEAIVARSASFDLAGIWMQIQAVSSPNQTFRPAPRMPIRRDSTLAVLESAGDERLVRNTAGAIAALSALVTSFAFFIPQIALATIPLCIVFVVWWSILKSNSPLGKIKAEYKDRRRDVVEELKRAQANQRAVAQRCQQQFAAKLQILQTIKDEFGQLKARRLADLQALFQNVRQRQLDEYLRQCFISGAKISGIGSGRIAALESYGIETAYDVNESAVGSVPGFGEAMTARLLEWKQEMIAAFRFNPTKGVPQADIQAREMLYAQKQYHLERELSRGPDALRLIAGAANAEIERLDVGIARMEHDLAQVDFHLQELGKYPWWY